MSAHTDLINSNLRANATVVQFPKEISLTFGNSLLVLGKRLINFVQVINPTGEIISSDNNRVHGSILSNTLSLKRVVVGKYRVVYRVVAGDGHVVKGGFLFYVKK